jgi:hypothetical protein
MRYNAGALPCSNTSQPQAKPVDRLAQGVKLPDATGRYRRVHSCAWLPYLGGCTTRLDWWQGRMLSRSASVKVAFPIPFSLSG